MVVRKRPDLELNDREFDRLLALVEILDEVQLLRLQCRVALFIGDPPQWMAESSPARVGDTLPPPSGLGGPYDVPSKSSDMYEELTVSWEDEDTEV